MKTVQSLAGVGLVLMQLLSACAYTDSEVVEEFAERLKKIIVDGKIDEFKQLPCSPSNCVHEENIVDVFGSKSEESVIRRLLQNPGTKFRIVEHYGHSSGSQAKEYSIFYYDPDIVKFDDKGLLSQEDRESLWRVGYIETVVTFEEGRWSFKYTPFYYGSHLPWVDDYG